MRISDWSSDVCSSDLIDRDGHLGFARHHRRIGHLGLGHRHAGNRIGHGWRNGPALADRDDTLHPQSRSEEHTSELQSLMRISYAVFCLKKKKNTNLKYIKKQKNKTK